MKLREALGLFLAILGGGVVLCFIIFASFYRYAHPKLTETELQLWSFDHWYAWLLPLVIGFCGFLLFITGRERK